MTMTIIKPEVTELEGWETQEFSYSDVIDAGGRYIYGVEMTMSSSSDVYFDYFAADGPDEALEAAIEEAGEEPCAGFPPEIMLHGVLAD